MSIAVVRRRGYFVALAMTIAAFIFMYYEETTRPTNQPAAATVTVTPDTVKQHFSVLPPVAESPSNSATPAKVALGKALFFDPRLSKSGFISCNSCHNLASGGVDSLPTSVGHRWQLGPRNAPTVLNVALHTSQFWDGRAADVEEQAGKPVLNPGEMASTEELVLQRLKSIPEYVDQFGQAFPGEGGPLTYPNVAKAIAAFERTLMTPSRFDKFLGGDSQALSTEEKAGLQLFVETGCVSCHNGVTVGGNSFQKFGVVSTPEGLKDAGRVEVTKDEKDRFVFKVPSLRNIALTAPYFHDGKTWTLEEAVRVMADVQLGKKLSLDEVAGIVKFLKALNGEPALQVVLPDLPPSTATTTPPAFD
jgi:cytochrome c peroxidase